jgi:hypothetical protein
MSYQIAKTTEEAVRACDSIALDEPGDPRYVDLSERYGLYRGGKNRLVERMRLKEGQSSRHIVLAGAGGSGKSTLVLQSFEVFRNNGLYPIHIDVQNMLDQGDIQYSDLLLSIVAGVAKAVENDVHLHGIKIDQTSMKDVSDWFNTRVLVSEQLKELQADVETGVKASYGIPIIGNLFAKVTAAFRVKNVYREEIRKNIDKSPNELVEKVNVFLDALTSALAGSAAGYRGILVFFDNLEKVANELEQVDRALINKSTLFRQVRCNAIYTIPYGLLLKPGQAGLVQNEFIREVVPMIALRRQNDPPNVLDPFGKESLIKIIEQRIDVPSIFESADLLDDIIRYSGGCVRDLLNITRLACEYAGEAKVNREAVQQALKKARADHLMSIKSSDFPILARIHRDKYIDNTPAEFELLSYRLLLPYNDTVWFDAHPLAQDEPRFKKATIALEALGGQ